MNTSIVDGVAMDGNKANGGSAAMIGAGRSRWASR